MDDDVGLKKGGFPDQKIGEFQEEQKIKASIPNFFQMFLELDCSSSVGKGRFELPLFIERFVKVKYRFKTKM